MAVNWDLGWKLDVIILTYVIDNHLVTPTRSAIASVLRIDDELPKWQPLGISVQVMTRACCNLIDLLCCILLNGPKRAQLRGFVESLRLYLSLCRKMYSCSLAILFESRQNTYKLMNY
jgi:hypothetical protein